MKRTKEKAEITRQFLLKTALEVFSEKGYAATRLSDIAEAAQVTRGAIYHHFGNKKELFICLFQKQFDTFFDIMTEILSENISPIERLKKILLVTFEKIVTDKDFKARYKLDIIGTTFTEDVQEIKNYMVSRGENLYKMVIQLIHSGIQTNEIRNDVDPNAIADTFIALLAGFKFVTQTTENVHDFSLQIDGIVNVFMNGVVQK